MKGVLSRPNLACAAHILDGIREITAFRVLKSIVKAISWLRKHSHKIVDSKIDSKNLS